MNQALALQGAGRIAEAEALYRQVLGVYPEHPGAVFLLGLCRFMAGDHAAALRLMDASIELDPDVPSAHYNRGLALQQLGRLEEALDSYERAIERKPDHAQAFMNRGRALFLLQRVDEAIACCNQALALAPQAINDYMQWAANLAGIGRFADALVCFEKVIDLQPGMATAHNNRGAMLLHLERHAEALTGFDRAVALDPGYVRAHSNRGLALHGLGRYADALAAFDRAIELDANLADSHYNRALTLQKCRRFEEALAGHERAIALDPGLAEAHCHRALMLYELGRYQEALASVSRAIDLKPDYAEAYSVRGMVLQVLERFPEALADLTRALELDPDTPYTLGDWCYTKMLLADWDGLDTAFRKLAAGIERGDRVANPFTVLSTPLGRAHLRICAEICARHELPKVETRWPDARPVHDRLRIGYFSSDFRNHAVAHQTAELFERHDRGRFEIYGFYLGPRTDDTMHVRLRRAFDHFLDLGGHSDEAIAQAVRMHEIDILVDLNGFTQNNRASVLARRPGPVQVLYLGYAGTLGADLVDYIVADNTVIPRGHQAHYREKVVRLPHSFMVSDTTKAISDRPMTRAEFGLPEDGFVFCCFNNTYKIGPDVFAIWMRLLGRVANSVLWLSVGNPVARGNLARAAESSGIAPQRLVFAERVDSLAEHLARYRQADLFLDTLHYNAHTTACDALWAGLPVLTCLGDTFASRVAASLLNAIDLPEMIAPTPVEYEALALELAHDPGRLAGIRGKLAANRLTRPLFDTTRFTRDLEQAYLQMWARHQAGLPPDHIDVAAQP